MKKTKIAFLDHNSYYFPLEGVLVAFTSQTELAKEGIRHLGYPGYFGSMLAVWKVLGTLAITIPRVPARIKEWAYAGLFFDFSSALISVLVVDGFGVGALLPLVFIILLIISYRAYHTLKSGIVVVK